MRFRFWKEKEEFVPPINVLIKPSSSNCNLNCSYCFYHDEAKHRSTKSFGFMNADTIETIIERFLSYAEKSCTFGFQGGEPMLAGLDFFKRVVEREKRYNTNHLEVHNAIQTNGTLIDDAWAAFFTEHNFLVGVSLDGYESLHNLYRRDAQGNGTFSRVMQGIEALKRNKTEFNILTVVTAQTAKHIKEAYAFFMREGLNYQQYIPCIEPLGGSEGTQKHTLTPKLYARFIKDLFDVWYNDRVAGRFVYNRYFENLAALLLGYRPESCDMNGACSIQYAIEANGSVFPCDFYMLDGYCIGNCSIDSLELIDENRRQLGFVEASLQLPQQCRTCGWFRFCRGGCQRNRNPAGMLNAGLNHFCESYREAFPYILPRLKELL